MAGVSMKSIKLRIRSMESTKQITKAMEMVASSKLRRAQANIQRSRPYFEILYNTMLDIASVSDDMSSPYFNGSENGKSLFIVIGGDRGLAGGYNHNIFKLSEANMVGKNSFVLPIGKKSFENFRAHGYELFSDELFEADSLSISSCFSIALNICNEFVAGNISEVFIAYTNFVSMLSQTPCIMQLLPLNKENENSKGSSPFTMYEPDALSVFNSIVPEYLGGFMYGALCESIASEQAARRTAMDSATKNATDMISDLSLKYNRARQGAITQEITEIVAGADA